VTNQLVEATDVERWLRGYEGTVIDATGSQTRRVNSRQLISDVERVRQTIVDMPLPVDGLVGVRSNNSYDFLVVDLALIMLNRTSVVFPPEAFKNESVDQLAGAYDIAVLLDEESGSAPTRDGGDPHAVGTGLLKASFPTPPIVDGRLAVDAEFTRVFSSGTTGSLKCLRIGWGGVRRLVDRQLEEFQIDRDDSLLIALPLAMFQQRFLCYCALASSADIVLSHVGGLAKALREEHPTFLLGPPAFFNPVANRALNEGVVRRALRSAAATAGTPLGAKWRRFCHRQFASYFGARMRVLLVGSAPVPNTTLSAFEQIGLPLLEIYGMTETGFISWNTPSASKLGTAGRPVFDGTVELSQDDEIVVRHPWHIALGYAHDCHDGAFETANIVRTGDIGSFDSDGFLTVVGRVKSLIVLEGGQKVQPEEVEAHLRHLCDVPEALVIPNASSSALGVVVFVDNAAVELRSLQLRLVGAVAQLPPRHAVRQWVVVTGLPTTTNGLLNRNLKPDRAECERRFRAQLVPLNRGSSPNRVPADGGN
jgi:long-chain acyl-CoA synthetase